MKEENYEAVSNWFRAKESRLKIFKNIYKLLPVVVVAVYGGLIIFEIMYADIIDILKVILVPLITFSLCTVVRKLINAKRPYEIMDIKPLIHKDKRGQSFPSRHVVSATVIAMAALYVNIELGIVMMIICLLICIIRPIAGVHFVRDVVGGMTYGVIMGIVGFYLL